jgi:type II secretory pathway predicted ATPase ExeA
VWLRHWGLAREPFGGPNPPYVSLPSHDEAVARLVYSIERAERRVGVFAEAGLGKTTVVRRAIRETRDPHRRAVLATAPPRASGVLGVLADAFHLPSSEASDPDRLRRSLRRVFRAADVEGCHLVVVVDDCEGDHSPAILKDLAELGAAGPLAGPPASVVLVGRGRPGERPEWADPWTLAIRLERLTRSQAAAYLTARLAEAGCRDRVFTPRAVSRLQAWSEGVPRGLDRLATLALMAGAVQGLEVVPPEVVDAVARESLPSTIPALAAG